MRCSAFFRLILISLFVWTTSCTLVLTNEEDASNVLSLQFTNLVSGEAIRGGESYEVTWETSGDALLTALASIEYSVDGGDTWDIIAEEEENDGSYLWDVPAIDVTDVYLKITFEYEQDDETNETLSISAETPEAIEIDSIAPATPDATLTSAAITNNVHATFTVASCLDVSHILVSQSGATPSENDSSWQECDTASSAIQHSFTSESNHTLRIWAKDRAGHISSAPDTEFVTYDATPPNLTLTSLTGGSIINGNGIQAITWSASDVNFDATPITVEYSLNGGSSWSTLAASTANDGTENWNTAGIDNSQVRVRVTASDTASNTTIVQSSSNFTLDSTGPIISAMNLNSSATLTYNNNVSVTFNINDSTTNVSQFCLKYNVSTQPLAGDSCWKAISLMPAPNLAPAKSLSVSGSNTYSFQVGFVEADYTVYGWAKDEAGNIGTLSSTGSGTDSVDKKTIHYAPGTPPTLVDILVASVDDPASITSDTIAPAGSDVYIKWNASDVEGLKATPISIYYSTDDTNYTLAASNLLNGQNGSCTIDHAGTSADDSSTGCYHWSSGSPTSSYYKIQVRVEDTEAAVTLGSSTAINVSSIRFLAGNTDPGTDGAASAALFFHDTSLISDTEILAISSTGVYFFRDSDRGLLIIDPSDGIQRILIPKTGVSSGDGGDVALATLKDPIRIVMDHQDRLLVFDYDRIRRIDTTSSPMTIDTIIGGGGLTSHNVDPLDLSISNPGSIASGNGKRIPLIPLPNGDIWFQSDGYGSTPATNHSLRRYNATSGLVEKIVLGGTGYYDEPTEDLTLKNIDGLALEYDPVTSVIQKMLVWVQHPVVGDTQRRCASIDPSTFLSDGAHPDSPIGGHHHHGSFITALSGTIYHATSQRAYFSSYSSGTNTWTKVAGTGTKGKCVDGTPAVSCNLQAADLYETSQGQIYIVDNGLIRTIDGSGNMLTVMGQSLDFGDGGHPLSARLGNIDWIDQKNNGDVIVLDTTERRVREFSLNGVINTIAGTGNVGTQSAGQTAATSNISMDSFTVEPVSGDLYTYGADSGASFIKLNRSNGLWESWIGNAGSSTYYHDGGADGTDAANIAISSYRNRVMGFGNNQFLIKLQRWMSPGHENSYLKLYDKDTRIQSHLVGKVGAYVNTACGDGTSVTDCETPYGDYQSRASYNASTGDWYLHFAVGGHHHKIRKVNTAGGTMETYKDLPRSISTFTWWVDGSSHEILGYCGNDGKLYTYNVTTSVETELTWPIATLSCKGDSMKYYPANNSIVFIYEQSGLQGIAEYLLP